MFHALSTAVSTAMLERSTLFINHVLSSEPLAMQRLRAHRGRCIRLHAQGWPSPLPALPDAAWRITAAGLLEWCGEATDVEAALQLDIDASNPARLALLAVAGERPRIDVAGDAALAADVNWLIDNLRWDAEGDLEGLVGPAAAHQLAVLGRAVAAALQGAAQSLANLGRGAGRSAPP
jgi:ubiquinone biosynthesis accessory factor UbiJ